VSTQVLNALMLMLICPDFLFTPPCVQEVMEAGECMMNVSYVLV